MRFGRRGLPELVHEFSIDPPAVPFISDKPLRVHPPAGSPRLLSLAPSSSSSPGSERPEKSSTLSASRPRSGSPRPPSLGQDPSPPPPLPSLPHADAGCTGLLPSGREQGQGPTEAEKAGRGRAGHEGAARGAPTSPGILGMALCAPGPREALRGPPARARAGSLDLGGGPGRTAAPQEPPADPGAGRASAGGGEGVREKGK